MTRVIKLIRLSYIALLVSLLTAGPLFADNEIGVKIIDFGLYSVGVAQKGSFQGSSKGELTFVGDIQLLDVTAQIPAKQGTRFGIRYIVTGPADGTVIPITVKFFNPLHQYNKSDGLVEEWITEKAVGVMTFDGFLLEKKTELIPGTWTVELYHNNEKIDEKEFLLTRYEISENKSSEQKAFEKTVKKNSIDAYQSFLLEYPKSIYRAEIENRRFTLRSKQKREEGQSKVPKMIKPQAGDGQPSQDYFLYSKVDTIWGYERFLAKHPDSEYSSDVQAKIERLSFEQSLGENDIESLILFQEKFPNSKYFETVSAKIKQIEKERTIYQEFADKGSIESFQEYLLKYSEGHFSEEATKAITKLAVSKISVQKNGGIYCVSRKEKYHDVANIYFKNKSRFPVMFYISGAGNFTNSGEEHFFVTFQPGQSGRIDLLSGKYTVIIQVQADVQISLAGEAELSGSNVVYFDGDITSAAIIEFKQRIERYAFLPPFRTYTLEDYKQYERDLAELLRLKNDKLKEIYPILRRIPGKIIRRLKRSEKGQERLIAARLLNEYLGEKANKDIMELFDNTGVYGLTNGDNKAWAFIVLLRDEILEKQKYSVWDNTDFFQRENLDNVRRGTNVIFREEDSPINGLIMGKCNEEIVEALPYVDKKTRLLLIYALSEIGVTGYENIYEDLLSQSDHESRLVGLIALKKSLNADTFPLLEKMLFDEQNQTNRRYLYNLLWHLSQAKEVPFAVNKQNSDFVLSVDRERVARGGKPFLIKSIPRANIDDSIFDSIKNKPENDQRIICEALAGYAEERDFPTLVECIESNVHLPKMFGLQGLANIKSDKAALQIIEAKERMVNNKIFFEALWTNGSKTAINYLASELKAAQNCNEKMIILRELKTYSPQTIKLLLDDYGSDETKTQGCQNYYSYGDILKELAKNNIVIVKKIAATNKSDEFKRLVLYAIRYNTSPAAKEIVYEYLKDSNQKIREQAIEILINLEGVYKDEQAYELLVEAMHDKNIPKNELISLLLKKGVLEKHVNEVKTIFIQDLDKGIINYTAFELLGKTEQRSILAKALPLILDNISKTSPEGRVDYKMVRFLGLIGNTKALQAIIDLYKKKRASDSSVLSAIEKSKNENAVPFLLEFLESYGPVSAGLGIREKSLSASAYILGGSGYTVTALDKAIIALGEIADQRAIEPLSKILKSGTITRDSHLYENILSSISRIGGLQADLLLIEEFKSMKDVYANYWTRFQSSFSRISSQEVVENLHAIFETGDQYVKKQVILSLKNIKGHKAIAELIFIVKNSRSLFEEAVRSVAAHGDEAVPYLDKLYREVGRKEREAIISALRDIKSVNAMFALARILSSGESSDQNITMNNCVKQLNPEFFIEIPVLNQIASERKRLSLVL